MTPENANVYLVEDNESLRESTKALLELDGHNVVAEAATLDEALEGISKARDAGVQVAVVDGNLSQNDLSGNDGNTVADALRKAIPGIKIISYSSDEQDYGDVHVSKDVRRGVSISEVITKL